MQDSDMARVRVFGDGVAARAAGHLLRQAGVSVAGEGGGKRPVPAVLVGEATQRLFADVLGDNSQFASAARVERRIVAWGENAEARSLPHEALLVAEADLLASLPALPEAVKEPGEDELYCRKPLPASAVSWEFGARRAYASVATLSPAVDRGACYVEAVGEGWLFLLPNGQMLRVGEDPEALWKASRLVRGVVEEPGTAGAAFDSQPRMAWPLGACGERLWLAAGSAAMGFDPLCGDGTGNALREAILAAAVLTETEPSPDMVEHYGTRLLLGFSRHLAVCRDFYGSGGAGAWWREQVQQTERGLAWCAGELTRRRPAVWRLEGFRLRRIGS